MFVLSSFENWRVKQKDTNVLILLFIVILQHTLRQNLVLFLSAFARISNKLYSCINVI